MSYCQGCADRDQKIAQLRAVLAYMVNRFAFAGEWKAAPADQRLSAGGISALESAFDILGLPHQTTRREVWELWQDNVDAFLSQAGATPAEESPA